jgi:hypothetical protein
MFNTLFMLLKNSSITGKSSLDVLCETIHVAKNVIEHFEENYAKDINTYDAAIDTFCEILQEHKSKKHPVTPPPAEKP